MYENNWGNGPRSTPTIDGDRAYALSATGVLACLTIRDGKVLWTTDLVKDLGGRARAQDWGYTESVLIDGNNVVCTPGGSKGTMAALDKMTGKLLWQSKDLSDAAQYSSPILVEAGGQRQYVQLISRRVFGVKPASGEVLWQAEFPARDSHNVHPSLSQRPCLCDRRLQHGDCRMFRASGDTPELVYDNTGMVNHHGGVITLVNGKIFGHSDKGGWTCQDFMTGETLWQDKSFGKGCCSFVAGHLVCVEESSGTVALVEASTSGWKEKSRFTMEPQTKLRKPQGRIWTHPVILNGRLYLRDQDLIYCTNVRGA